MVGERVVFPQPRLYEGRPLACAQGKVVTVGDLPPPLDEAVARFVQHRSEYGEPKNAMGACSSASIQFAATWNRCFVPRGGEVTDILVKGTWWAVVQGEVFGPNAPQEYLQMLLRCQYPYHAVVWVTDPWRRGLPFQRTWLIDFTARQLDPDAHFPLVMRLP